MTQRDLLVQSFSLRPDGFVEIAWVEVRDQADRAGIVRTVIAEVDLVGPRVEEILDDLADLVDEIQVHIRNPSPMEGLDTD